MVNHYLPSNLINIKFDPRKFSVDEHVDEFDTRWQAALTAVAAQTNLKTSHGAFAALQVIDTERSYSLKAFQLFITR
jgi:hypothetical protein